MFSGRARGLHYHIWEAKNMLKKLGLPAAVLVAMLVLMPAPANAKVHFGVTIKPRYAYPVDPYVYQYPYAYPNYYYSTPYWGPTYVAPYPHRYGFGWGDRGRRHERWEHERHEHERRWRR